MALTGPQAAGLPGIIREQPSGSRRPRPSLSRPGAVAAAMGRPADGNPP
jgi:hypothetical protein